MKNNQTILWLGATECPQCGSFAKLREDGSCQDCRCTPATRAALNGEDASLAEIIKNSGEIADKFFAHPAFPPAPKKSTALVSENCKLPMATVLSDSSVGVGNSVRTETTVNRYCEKCRQTFLDSLRGAGE